MGPKVALSLDIGHSTGVVIGRILPRVMPDLVEAKALGTQAPESIPIEFNRLLRTFEPEYLVVEQVHPDRKSSMYALTLNIYNAVWSWLGRAQAEHPKMTVLVVKAADWKTTPSIDVAVFQSQTHPMWRGYHPSTHENDAARLLHWYAFTQMKEL